MMTPQDPARLRGMLAGNDSLDAIARFCRKRADSILTAKPCTYPPNGGPLLQTSRTVLDRVTLLAFISILDSEPRYAARALQELDSAARFPDWGPDSFLGVAEMATAFAVGYDWLYGSMTPDTRSAYREALRSKAFAPALRNFRDGIFWSHSKGNWNIVCNTGLIIAGLAVVDEDTSAKAVIEKAVGSLQSSGSLAVFGPDGAYPEGIMYWGYTGRYLSMFLSSLQSSLGNTFGFGDLPGMAETGLFPIYSEGPTLRLANFGDASDGRTYPFWMGQFAQQYKNPLYSWYSVARAGLCIFDYLWFASKRISPVQAGLPISKRFRGSDIAVFRGAWDDSLAGWVAFKAGNTLNDHSHLDAGSFVYEVLGRRWAMQMGPDNYGLPGYFMDYGDSLRRFNYYRVRAEGHNTLTLNPGPGADQSFNGKCGLTEFDAARQTAVADLTPAYAGKALRAMRGVGLRNRSSAWIQDEVELTAAGTIVWRMHTEASVAVAVDGRSASLTLNGKRLWVGLGSPSGARLASVAPAPDPLSPRPAGQSANHGISVLQVRLENVRQAVIVVWMVPLGEGEAPPDAFPNVVPLDSPAWKPGTALRLMAQNPGHFSLTRNGSLLRIRVAGEGPFRLVGSDARGAVFLDHRGRAPSEWNMAQATVPAFGFFHMLPR
jgi:hypothetical protein